MENMENFIDNAGHELKTPLATIDSFLWIFDETKSYDEKMIKNVRKEIEKTNNLIETLRDLSAISKNTKKEDFDVSQILDEILYSYKDKILEKKLKIYIEKEYDIKLHANKNYFYILISNII
jgi:signal transduction histidine kinase